MFFFSISIKISIRFIAQLYRTNWEKKIFLKFTTIVFIPIFKYSHHSAYFILFHSKKNRRVIRLMCANHRFFFLLISVHFFSRLYLYDYNIYTIKLNQFWRSEEYIWWLNFSAIAVYGCVYVCVWDECDAKNFGGFLIFLRVSQVWKNREIVRFIYWDTQRLTLHTNLDTKTNERHLAYKLIV